MIEIHCKKCNKRWVHDIGVGFTTGTDSRQIMLDDKELLKYIPAPDRTKIIEMAKSKTIFLDLYAGNMMCKCDKCNTFNSRLAAKVVDKNDNVLYEVLPQKCPKCHQLMHYIRLENDEDVDLDDENAYIESESDKLAKQFTICPECGGGLECHEVGCWD